MALFNTPWLRLLWVGCIAPLLMTCSLGISAAVNQAEQTDNAKLTLNDCHLKGIRQRVTCGTLEVPQNYQQPDGTQISINFAVLPAIDDSEYFAPLMFLAGGPGQAAVELAAQIRKTFTEIRKKRDIILVDQRGTGKSAPLQCPGVEVPDVYTTIPEQFSSEDVKSCLAELKGDLSQFNSENAIRDFDAVRNALGHQQLNLYGGSYGTRAALVYMRLFPQSLRSVVLDSVGPIEVPIGLFGQSAARSFELMLANCQADEVCAQAYPNLKQEFEQLVASLAQSPVTIDIPHPRLGTTTVLHLSKAKLLGYLRLQMYSMATRAMMPLIIAQTYRKNYAPLTGFIAATADGMGVYDGVLFNIVCNEDIPRISAQMFATDAANTFDGDISHQSFTQVCDLWPKYQVSEAFYQPVTATIPTLILSGDLDPVTPPSNGEYPAKTLPNSHHIIDPNSAHIVTGTLCATIIVNEFLTSLQPKTLDISCLADNPKPSFIPSLNGGHAL